MLGSGMTDCGEISIEGLDGPVVHDSSTSEKEEIVEETESVVVRLMD